MARSISARAISGFVRAVRHSAGTPARSNRDRSLVQLSGRNNRNASTTGTSPRASVSDTRVWQLEVSRIVGVQLEIALYEFYEGQLPLQESLRLMNDLGSVPAIIDPTGYYDATDPCRLMEMDGVFIRRRHPT